MTATRSGRYAKSIRPPKPVEGDRLPGVNARHGTTSGFSRHQEMGEEPCESCRAAKAYYDWEWLQAPDKVRRNRLFAKAQARATTELRRAHPEEYAEAYQRHRAALLAEAMAEDAAEDEDA